MCAFNGKLYFAATNGIDGHELWTSDGTESGTYMVKT
jgi:ELWxxDGT repeat protein